MVMSMYHVVLYVGTCTGANVQFKCHHSRNIKEIIVVKIILLQKWKHTRIKNEVGEAGTNNFHANENYYNGQASNFERQEEKV